MTEHVCPVGALTSRDFRFKARVWFLKTQKGVCSGCATGCSTHIDFDKRSNRVYRLRPRDNEDVNGYWMCDDGMMTYKEVHEDRVLSALVGRGEDGHVTSSLEALKTAAAQLQGVSAGRLGVVLSAYHSSEDNFALVRFARETLATDRLYLAARGGWEGDDILRNADNNPNRLGAVRAARGASVGTVEDLLRDADSGVLEAVTYSRVC